MESAVRTKMMAGLGLVCVQTSVGVLYKISQAAAGGFKYSTMSAVAIAEFVKLSMSMGFHIMDETHHEKDTSMVVTGFNSATSQLSKSAVMHIFSLSFLYALNNQLSFYVYTLADPGTIFLFKAASTMIVALIQCTFVGKKFNDEQWKAMMLQAMGMVIVQHDPCRSRARYHWLAYALLALSAVLTSLCAVRNEYLVKNYKIGLNVQNAVLYAGGAWMNLLAFFVMPNPNNSQASMGFLDGYDNPLAIAVIVANSMIGLAITAVYKYADAITKCIASDITAVVLCILSSFFFNLQATLTMWMGVGVVCFAVHYYTNAASMAQQSGAARPATYQKVATDGSPAVEASALCDEAAPRAAREVQLSGKAIAADEAELSDSSAKGSPKVTDVTHRKATQSPKEEGLDDEREPIASLMGKALEKSKGNGSR